MANEEVLAVDLGQSGCRIKQGDLLITSDRGKLVGEAPLASFKAIFESIEKLTADVVSLSCTGFNGVVQNPESFGELCAQYFGATKVAVIDDGFAGFVGALNGRNGVVLSIGGGVVSVGGNEGKFAHRDGLGSTFGDEGGGFWLGKLAITKALGIRQGRGDDQEMLDYFAAECAAFDALEVKNNAEAATLAIRTAKKVLDAADAGVSTATAIVDEGAYLLAQTVVATWYGCGGTKADSPEIVIQGGPARNATYATKIALEINAKLPNAVIVKSAGDNLDGATWIANNLRQDAPPLLLWAGL
ncbi:COG2971 Predicted N-acetylglucosamine kinase [Candidatus Nanopelagicaceae bacterium]